MAINLDKNIQLIKFKDINLDVPFFDSLKDSYKEFVDWFRKKSEEYAYVMPDDDGDIQAFLYLKEENEAVTDVVPPLPKDKYLKMGTFKINAHGTKLGERFVKKIFDYALNKEINKIYVTIFKEHEGLIRLLESFGFEKIAEKKTGNGTEDVFLKQIGKVHGQVELDYPLISLSGNQYLLGVYPKFHTRLFPDSMLQGENANIIDDVSHTNSIQKIYICRMQGVEDLIRGDALVIYRTGDGGGPAWYRAVATSICMVEETKGKDEFHSLDEYLGYCSARSIFTNDELASFYKGWNKLFVIKMCYNAALKNRIIRKHLVEKVGLSPDDYWGFMSITSKQLRDISLMGGIHDSLIID